MAKSDLTAERVRELFDCDPETGVLTHRTPNRRAKVGDVAGFHKGHGYVGVCIDRSIYAAHRIVWLWCTGEWPRHTLDHINGDKTDNRLANLRDIDFQTNCENVRKPNSRNKSGVLGAGTYPHGKFRAQIKVNGRRVHLGMFATPEEAQAAYLEAKRKHHAGCTI